MGDDGNSVNTVSLHKCNCLWSKCWSYQKAFRRYCHPTMDGVVKIKFFKSNPMSMALKNAIDECLNVDPERREAWKKNMKGQETTRYYIARHHFTEPHLRRALSVENYNWAKPFTKEEARQCLWIVDDNLRIKSGGKDYYVQCCNVSKDHVRSEIKMLKLGLKPDSAQPTSPPQAPSHSTSNPHEKMNLDDLQNNVDKAMVAKEKENAMLRNELAQCQEQLRGMAAMIQKLQHDMEVSQEYNRRRQSNGASAHSRSRGRESRSKYSYADYNDDETIETIDTHLVTRNKAYSKAGRRNSVNSRASAHSRNFPQDVEMLEEDSYDSDNDDNEDDYNNFNANNGNRKAKRRSSAHSASPSLKSLPREIGVEFREEDDGEEDDEDESDDDSDGPIMFNESHRNRSTAQSVCSTHSRAYSVASTQSRATIQSASRSIRSLPREEDIDEAEKEESEQTERVIEHFLEDPYGEKGRYTGYLSKTTKLPQGKGRLDYDTGRWYDGDWVHGRWNGFGRLSNGDGDIYEGGVKNDHKHGKGIMKFADGRVFKGEYVKGQMVQGRMTYQDGSSYQGEWSQGMRHGRGRCKFSDGSVYDGEFRDGDFDGQGTMTWSDGGWYKGEWWAGEMHGFGKEIRPDGSLRHEGEWRKGQPVRKTFSGNNSKASSKRRPVHAA